MNRDEEKEKEFELLIEKFSRFIKFHIQKFNLNKYGLDPDDIYQEIKIKIWKILHDEKKIIHYASYIKKIVYSSVIDQLRKLKREDGIFLHEKNRRISENKNHYTAQPYHSEKDLKEMVGQAVECLIESRRKVVKLYLLNMSIEEIALYFHWSTDKTRNLLYRGLSDLKKTLKEKGMEYDHNP